MERRIREIEVRRPLVMVYPLAIRMTIKMNIIVDAA